MAYVPQGSDDNSTTGISQVMIEAAATPLASPVAIAADRVNSCTPAQSGEVVCSGQGGTADLIPAAGGTPTLLPLSGSVIPTNEYTTGDCQGCGAMVDDALSLGIISSGLGYVPVDLTTSTVGSPIAVNGTNADEVPGVVFGYDNVNHLILSASYTVDPNNNFASSPPRFHVVNISTPASPILFEFSEGPGYFNANSRTCGSSIQNDKLPDTTAIDTLTHIAYVTFHTPSPCFNAPPNDIAMFDMSQAVFTPGSMGSPNTWDTPSKAFQAITGTPLNGIDPISVEPNSHLALVSAGDNSFGVLQLPTASGAGNPLSSTSITDWVSASMPNDPNSVAWQGWHQPNGLATYFSPNSSKAIGVLMNNPGGGGPTYLAIVDMQGLLNPAIRDTSPGNGHKVDSSVNLLTSGLVTFVKAR